MREKAYRVYVTDCLKVLTENTAKLVGGGYAQQRYMDLIEPKQEEARTPEEIINQVKRALNGGENE